MISGTEKKSGLKFFMISQSRYLSCLRKTYNRAQQKQSRNPLSSYNINCYQKLLTQYPEKF